MRQAFIGRCRGKGGEAVSFSFEFYESIQLSTFVYSGGEGSHLYYAPASSMEEYEKQAQKWEEFVLEQ